MEDRVVTHNFESEPTKEHYSPISLFEHEFPNPIRTLYIIHVVY